MDTFTHTAPNACAAECQSGDGTAINVNAGWSDLAIIVDRPAMLGCRSQAITLTLSPADAARLGAWLLMQAAMVQQQGRAAA